MTPDPDPTMRALKVVASVLVQLAVGVDFDVASQWPRVKNGDVDKLVACHLRDTESVVEFSIAKQLCVGSYDRATELHYQAPAKIQPESLDDMRFTHRARHGNLNKLTTIHL